MADGTVSKDGIDKLIGWVTGLPFLNVLLLILIGVIGGLGYYTVQFVIPGEREAISAMIDRVEDRYVQERKDREEQHTKQIQQITTSFDRALDRMSLRPAIGATSQPSMRSGG